MEAVCVPEHLALPGPCKPSSFNIFTLNSHWLRAATGQKSLVFMRAGSLRSCQASLSDRGFSRQEYWSVLANTGCHTLLEHYISCSPSYQLPLVAGAARIPVTQATAQPPHLALNVADPNPPRQPQEQTPVDDPHAKVEIKPLLKPRGSVAKEEDSKPSHKLYKLKIKSK